MSTDTPETGPGSGSLEGHRAWQELAVVWGEAVAVASGKRGSYPFDRAGKAALLSALKKAQRGVSGLRDAGLLAAAEANLLLYELGILADRVGGYLPKEETGAMCYAPGQPPVVADFRRVRERLPLLRQLAASSTVKPEVLKRVLSAAAYEAAQLNEDQLPYLPSEEHPAALAARRETEDLVRQLRALAQKTGP